MKTKYTCLHKDSKLSDGPYPDGKFRKEKVASYPVVYPTADPETTDLSGSSFSTA